MVAEKIAIAPAVAQLRGELMTLLAKIEDEDTLAEVQDYILGLLGHVDMLDDMPPEVLKELEIAIEESYDESDTISNEEAFKLFRQWAKSRDDADWNRLATEQFFAGYTDADAVYDKL